MAKLPEQQAVRAKRFHPEGTFVEFDQAEIEQSIPQAFSGSLLDFASDAGKRQEPFSPSFILAPP